MLYYEVMRRGKFPKFYSCLAALWLTLDICAVIFALFAILLLHDIEHDHHFYILAGLTALCIFFIYPLIELFNRIRTRPIIQESLYLYKAWYKVTGLLILFGFVTGHLYCYPIKTVVIWIIAAYLIQLGLHLGIRYIMNRLRGHGYNIRYALLVGTHDYAHTFYKHLLNNSWMGIEVVGYLCEAGWEQPKQETSLQATSNLPLLGELGELETLIDKHAIGEVFITLPAEKSSYVETVAKALLNFPINTYWVPSACLPTYLNHYISNIDGNPVICISDSPIRKGQQSLKRVFDIITSLILLTLLSPLLLLISLAIKINSPGPVIYRQIRHGLYGQEVYICKFRTMRITAEGESEKQATRMDDRITPVGHFLRRWSLDELPQLFNVLQGSMSIIGPRPHPVWLNQQYRGKLDAYMLRHHVRPGITGWAQVNGLRGETDTIEKMNARLEYDLYYINNWSPLLDIKIFLMTLRAVIVGENAF